jgi:hypothetical protein
MGAGRGGPSVTARLGGALLLACLAAFTASALDIEEIRRGIYAADVDPEARARLEAAIREAYPVLAEAPANVRAYAATLRGIEGRQVHDLLRKIICVQEGIEIFDGVVEMAPDDLEARFLRYAFYSELPAFFGVSIYTRRDLAILTSLLGRRDYSSISEEQQQDMIRHVLRVSRINARERVRLESLLTY